MVIVQQAIGEQYLFPIADQMHKFNKYFFLQFMAMKTLPV